MLSKCHWAKTYNKVFLYCVSPKTEMKTNTDLDEFYEQIDRESSSLYVQTGQSAANAPDETFDLAKLKKSIDALVIHENIKLYDACAVTLWGKVPADTRSKMMSESNVYKLDCYISGVLMQPLVTREATTARFFLRVIKQFGMISALCNMQLFKLQSRENVYFMCSTMARRIDAKTILTGNFLFRFVSPKKEWKEDNINARVKYEESICKVVYDGVEVLQEKVVFENFFFDVSNHNVALPMLELNFL